MLKVKGLSMRVADNAVRIGIKRGGPAVKMKSRIRDSEETRVNAGKRKTVKPVMLGGEIVGSKIGSIGKIDGVVVSSESFRELVDPTVAARISMTFNPTKINREARASVSNQRTEKIDQVKVTLNLSFALG